MTGVELTLPGNDNLFSGNISNILTSRSQLEEEIYTEICANTNARVLNTVESYNQAMLPLGTQSSANNSSIALSTRSVHSEQCSVSVDS